MQHGKIKFACKSYWSFPLRIFSGNVTKSVETADLIICTEEILKGKLYFLCNGNSDEEIFSYFEEENAGDG